MTTTSPRRSMATDRDLAVNPQHNNAGTFALPRIVTSVPMNLFNSINPFAPADASKQPETKDAEAQQNSNLFFKRPILGSILGRPQPPSSNGPTTDTSDAAHKRAQSTTVMFAEPEVTDSDNASREGSVSDEARRQRRRNRAKTAFSICHPPPASLTRHKLHRRPRSLLQLHRLSATSRPVPAFEVIPSANFSVRLVKSITRVYKAKHGLCPNDFVILRAEKYYAAEHEEEQGEQDIVALICRGRSDTGAYGKAKICMSNGEEWEAYPHLNSGYEFSTTDDHGLAIVVRWVPKKGKDASKIGQHKRFNFSTIATNSRRHPVIASLTNTELDINDTYKVPDPAVSTPLSTPQRGDSYLAQAMEQDEDLPASDECVTDDRLRSIIAVTAIWVAFQEGWSPYYKAEDKEGKVTASPRKEGIGSPIIDTPPGSPAQFALDKRNSIRSVGSSLLRRSSMLSRANRDSTVSVDSITSTDTAVGAQAQPAAKTGRARADSNSTVLVHRAASNRRRNNQQATWRPDLLNVQNTVPETSREDLTRIPRSKSKRLSTIDSGGSPMSKKNSKPVPPPVSDDTDVTDTEHSPMGSKTEKRESSTTTGTSGSEPGRSTVQDRSSSAKKGGSTKKSGRWRKLLCIS